MNIKIFTVRDKKTKEIIHAEGVPHDECYSYFRINKKYFTDEEWNNLKDMGAWCTQDQEAYFDEEIRHLENYSFEKIVFNANETYEFISSTQLKQIK